MLVRQVDHVFCAVPGIEKVDGLMALFSQRCKLPTAWRAHHFRGFWNFYSGGVYLGNVIFEPVYFTSATRVKPHGISFQPVELNETLTLLEERGIPFQGPMPYLVQDKRGEIHHYWTNIVLEEFRESELSLFFCEFKPNPIFPRQEFGEETKMLSQALKTLNGGPLGLISVKEIVVGVPDLAEWRPRWQSIFEPLQANDAGAWQLATGPAVRLVPSASHGLRSLVIHVRSRPEAERFLADNDLLAYASEHELRVKLDTSVNLEICLV